MRRDARRTTPGVALREDMRKALALDRQVYVAVLRTLIQLGYAPPHASVKELQERLEVAQLEDQLTLPAKRRQGRRASQRT